MDKEIKDLLIHDTWETISRRKVPHGRKVTKSKWVYTIKYGGLYGHDALSAILVITMQPYSPCSCGAPEDTYVACSNPGKSQKRSGYSWIGARKKAFPKRHKNKFNYFGQRLSSDLCKFPTGIGGYKYAFCVVDAATNYLFVWLLKSKQSHEVREAMQVFMGCLLYTSPSPRDS